ncbi:MAG: DUF3160 domain-containing protein [Actinomycetota bacterium]
MNRRVVATIVLGLLTISVSSCGKGKPAAHPSPSPSQTVTPEPAIEITPLVRPSASAGRFAGVPLLSDAIAYNGPATPHSMSGVWVAQSLRPTVSKSAVSRALAANGFAIVPSDLKRFHQAYQNAEYEAFPVFVTTDTAYHCWHLVFDKILRDMESNDLLPGLEQLVRGLLQAARTQERELTGSSLAGPSNRAVQLVQVAAKMLGLDARPLGPEAQKEIDLIDGHLGPATSPILDAKVDYSLYVPRGHYTRSEDLKRYFKAMSVLGQSKFSLANPASLRLGLLVSRLLEAGTAQSRPLHELWAQIYDTTAFLVGSADDYTPSELAAAAKSVSPKGLTDATLFAGDEAVAQVARALTATRAVRIDPLDASVRVMGVRFVLDSFVFDQLMAPNVGSESKPRMLASPLDLAASFGSSLAYGIQKDAGETAYAKYDSHLSEMRTLLAKRSLDEWGRTVYDTWLYALEPMWKPHGIAFPDYMRSEAWARKDLQTSLGSYAELKHDTVLYTKQAFAEGDAGELPPPPRNWVEPDPVAFERLNLAATQIRDRLVLSDEQTMLMTQLTDMLSTLARIARDELAGKSISDGDNKRLSSIGGTLEVLWLFCDLGSQRSLSEETAGPQTDDEAAIVADILRGKDRSNRDVAVEVATGRVDRLYVLVPGEGGKFEVAVGGVYSYYEFLQPIADRLTDEAWRDMLDKGKAPSRPAWEQPILAR